jgi:4-carboxymuconolactone decarboxylase
MKKQNYDEGIKKRKKVLGTKYVNKAIKNKNLFNEDFQNFITINCWDKVWNNNYLSDKQKSFNTLCILAATNKWDEFQLHLEGSLNNGCNLSELKELFLQITLYCGVPTGNECFKKASELFKYKKININKSLKSKIKK